MLYRGGVKSNPFARAALVLLVALLTTTATWAQTTPSGNWSDEGNRAETVPQSDDGSTLYISTAEQLACYAYGVNNDWKTTGSESGYYCGRTIELLADIDLSAHYWTPIGDYTDTYFNGFFHGNGHVIRGMNISTDHQHIGFIAYSNIRNDGATSCITDLVLKDFAITCNCTNSAIDVGGLVGYNALDISNCWLVDGSVAYNSGNPYSKYVGWIVGFDNGRNTNCYRYNVSVQNVSESNTNCASLSIKGQGSVTLGDVGVMVDGKIYAASGQTVTLSHASPATGYVFGGYTSDDVTITDNTFTMPDNDVTVTATFVPDPAHFSVSDDGNTYTIHSAEGWDVFCDLLAEENGKTFFSGKTVVLAADISVTRMAGSTNHDFTGTFDGQKHKLTVNYGSNGDPINEENVAPFRNAEYGCIIKNLHVNGNIYTSNKYAAGLIGTQYSKVSIQNCRVSVNINSAVHGDGTHGGLVGVNGKYGATLTIDGCVFDGKILSISTPNTDYCGGFVGWQNTSVTITNSLYAPSTTSNDREVEGEATFSRNGATITNSYYTRALGTPQGKQAHTITAGDYVTVDFGGTATEYDVSGITAYTNGIIYNNTFYAGSEDKVALALSHTDRTNYQFDGYTTSSGTLDGSWLTMPDADVTISGKYTYHPSSVPYLDANGEIQTCTNYTTLTGSETFLDKGWYVAFGDINYSDILSYTGEVNLILADGCTMNIGTNANVFTYGIGSTLYGGESLTIYGQCNGNGLLSVYSEYYGISGTTKLTINGGKVEVNTIVDDYNAIDVNDFNYNGGILTTNAVNGNGVKASHNYTFSWRTLDDRITIGKTGIYVEDGYTANFTRLFSDNDGHYYYGIYTRDQLATLAGKTLIPAETVTIDGNSNKPVSFTNEIENVNVVFNRDFTQGINSTLILPFGFTLTDDFKANYGNFYSLQTIRYNEKDNQWEGWLENPVSDEVAANTPYVFVPSKTFSSMTFTGVTIQPTTPNDQSFGENIDDDNTEWTFKGTYTPIEFADFENQEKPIYGFAGTAKNNISVGEFVRAHDRVSIKPLRCYLEYNGKDKALTKSAVELPDNIVLRIISSATDPDESTDNPDSDITTPTSELAPAANVKVWSYDHTVYIAAAPGTPYRIIDALGRVLKDGITATDRDEIHLSNYGGIAIVIVKGKAYKVNY